MSDLFVVIFVRFFRLILAFLHCAYSGVQYFDLAQTFIRRKVKENFSQIQVSDAEIYVSNFVKELKKCPSHFVVILGRDGISFEDFTNLVVWCLAAKIAFLSFYDYTGNLKANQNIYYKYLVGKGKVNPSSLSFPADKHNPKNGISHKLYLSFLSMEDGKPLLVQLTKDISKRVCLNDLSLTEINEQFISKELFLLNGLPDPDLAVISGTICSSFGLLPWHIRVTEFLIKVKTFGFVKSEHCPLNWAMKQGCLLALNWRVKTIRGIHVSDFTKLLESYSSCDQRFGR